MDIGPDFMPYAVHDEAADLDPRERAIKALVDEVQSQRARIASLEDRLGPPLYLCGVQNLQHPGRTQN